jgi:hypothetical protein
MATVNGSNELKIGLPMIEEAVSALGTVVKHKKLHARAFYESLGSPKFVLAPMVDQSEFVSSRFCVNCEGYKKTDKHNRPGGFSLAPL